MEQLHVQPVRLEPRQLGDPVPLLEAQDELLAGVGDVVELLEPEGERGRVFALGVDELRLDVVRPAEVVTLDARAAVPRLAGQQT